jgi:hypothetical protein
MRLLKYKSNDEFELVTFGNDGLPPYAILSHTWIDGEEVTYDELLAGTGKDKAGYAKIRFCGERAAQDNIQYFWVDTCCINKHSSAELSESINRMYHWYRQAKICYAYIFDWPSELDWADLGSIIPISDTEGHHVDESEAESSASETDGTKEYTSDRSVLDDMQSEESISDEQSPEGDEAGEADRLENAAFQDNRSQYGSDCRMIGDKVEEVSWKTEL